MNEHAYDLLTGFSTWRSLIIPAVVSCTVEGRANVQSSLVLTDGQALAYYEALMALPVAAVAEDGSQSLFGHTIWDFNPNHTDAARNVVGAKLRMDWSKYPNVSPAVMLEMQVAFLLYHLAPGHIYSGHPNAKPKANANKALKANTVIMHFTDGMQFINELSIQDQKEYGVEYVLRTGQSIKDFGELTYRNAAENYEFSYSGALRKFLNIISSHYLAESVFGGHLPYVAFDKLNWKKRPETKGGDNVGTIGSDVLPSIVFERASYNASLLVVDFLDAMGEAVVDMDSLRRRNARKFNRASEMGLSPRLLDMYTFMRLKQKGYNDDFMGVVLGGISDQLSTLRPGTGATTISLPTLRALSDGRINEELRVYLNLVNYSCCYLVAQYTGMRPSELANIVLDNCLERDGSYWLLLSQVVKHREAYGKLFDDKWVAIPIIRDAIAVAKICAKYKQSPYLFSSVDTVAPEVKPLPLNSLGIQYQLNSFFFSVLAEDEFQSLEFSPYTLRHTLAFQMYRAEVGLPFISHQLKHFCDIVGGYENQGYSSVTLGYGHIGDLIEMGGRKAAGPSPYRHKAELEVIKVNYDPDGSFAGYNAGSHKARNKAIFQQYEEAGYSRDDIYKAMVDKGIAVVNVGMGMCYGGRVEDFDDSLPCIGSLRCNPNRCSNSVITQAHAPKWRELYAQNKQLLSDPFYEDRYSQINEVIDEARSVLMYLGESMEIEL